jgi:hypothetical protein
MLETIYKEINLFARVYFAEMQAIMRIDVKSIATYANTGVFFVFRRFLLFRLTNFPLLLQITLF